VANAQQSRSAAGSSALRFALAAGGITLFDFDNVVHFARLKLGLGAKEAAAILRQFGGASNIETETVVQTGISKTVPHGRSH
jgi:hypothetical protein